MPLPCRCTSVPGCSPVLICFWFFPLFLKLGTRHILEAMQAAGHEITTLFLCGGLSKNPLFVQMHADITGELGEVHGKEWKYFFLGVYVFCLWKNKDFRAVFCCMAKKMCN